MSVEARGRYRYFLTFADDLSRYGYIYLMKYKSETFEKFKEFQSEVENRRNKKMKFLQSDRGGKYLSYEFGLHLKQCGIVSQLTPPGTPQRNGVSERLNYTLLDMVRSMMSLTNLLLGNVAEIQNFPTCHQDLSMERPATSRKRVHLHTLVDR